MTTVNAQQEFWNWFIQHEVELFDFDPAQEAEREKVFDVLADQLCKVDPDLVSSSVRIDRSENLSSAREESNAHFLPLCH
jgi:hypothetical protein